MYKQNQHSIREQCAEIFLLHHANRATQTTATAAKRLPSALRHTSPTTLLSPNNAMHPALEAESTQIAAAVPASLRSSKTT